MYSRSAKGGEKGDPNRNPWLAKMDSNMTSFFRFVDKRAIYRWLNLIRTCAGECDWLFHWQHKLCATFSANVNINYRLPIKVYYRICTLKTYQNRNISWKPECLLSFNMGWRILVNFIPCLVRDKILISTNPC